MDVIQLSMLRGVCQMPGYVALAKGYFLREGLDVRITVAPTAWVVPQRLLAGEVQFAVMPWTRVAASSAKGEGLVVVCGSGCEEAAIVLRNGIEPEEVRSVAVPLRGGIKDLTARGLIASLGWDNVEWVRQPSGDGAIIAFVGRGADAASMVEPYASMLVGLGMGTVLRRTGDLWPGAPGCSLTTTRRMIEERPDVVEKLVRAYVDGARFIEHNPDEASRIATEYIGIDPKFIRESLHHCRPNVHAFHNRDSVASVLGLMKELGYVDRIPEGFLDGSFLEKIAPGLALNGKVAVR